MLDRKFRLDMEWQPYLVYQPLEPECSDVELREFVGRQQYQQKVNEHRRLRRMPVYLKADLRNGFPYFDVQFLPSNFGFAWELHHALSGAQFQQRHAELSRRGFTLKNHDVLQVPGRAYHVARWERPQNRRAQKNAGLNSVPLLTHQPSGARFPLKAYKKTKLGNSREIAGDATSGQNGILHAKVRVSIEDAFRGFTGSLCMAVLDAGDGLLWYGVSPDYGVNGEAVPGAPSRRVEFWRIGMPPNVMQRAAKLKVLGTQNPQGLIRRIKDVIRQSKRVTEILQ